ncbi:MAG: PHP domain-containing protein [Halobacteriota archaeon]
MSSVVADLHVHTTRSDGTIEPERIPEVAADHGCRAIAVTDHDRLPPWGAPVVELEGVLCIAGIELRVETEGAGRVDLLAYGVRSTPALVAELERLQRNRVERARAMVERLEDTLGIDLGVDPQPGIGRPHIARATAAATDLDYQSVFDRYIGDDGPCYVPRDVTDFDEGVDLLEEAAEAVVLAHPLRYPYLEAALALVDRLDGLEYVYPYEDAIGHDRLDRFLEGRDLLRTGGSDAHTHEEVARAGLDATGFEPVARRLGIAVD